MRLSTQVKPISYFKANAARIIDELVDGGPPVIVTQNGEAKAVVQSIADYERTQETLAMLKILAMAEHDVTQSRTRPAEDVFDDLESRLADR